MRKELYLTPQDLDRRVRRWVEEARELIPPYRRPVLKVESSALLVLDVQRYFFDPAFGAFLPTGLVVLPKIKELITYYAHRRPPGGFTRHALRPGHDPGAMGRRWKEVPREGEPGAELYPGLPVPPSSLVLRKDRYDAFLGANLEDALKGEGVEQVLICGVMTHLCCESTARGAFMRDFDVFLVADATATVKEDLHRGTLKAAAHGFAMPLCTEEVVHGGI